MSPSTQLQSVQSVATQLVDSFVQSKLTELRYCTGAKTTTADLVSWKTSPINEQNSCAG
jgi:hypothetical protein|tara:strand:+ start:427 stop:603 length:177 start_codon:yes stop_codon:yes gene_type:complete